MKPLKALLLAAALLTVLAAFPRPAEAVYACSWTTTPTFQPYCVAGNTCLTDNDVALVPDVCTGTKDVPSQGCTWTYTRTQCTAPTSTCYNGQCVECTADAALGTCTSTANCGGSSYRDCTASYTWGNYYCTGGTTCSGSTPHCSGSGTCVQCNSAYDCSPVCIGGGFATVYSTVSCNSGSCSRSGASTQCLTSCGGNCNSGSTTSRTECQWSNDHYNYGTQSYTCELGSGTTCGYLSATTFRLTEACPTGRTCDTTNGCAGLCDPARQTGCASGYTCNAQRVCVSSGGSPPPSGGGSPPPAASSATCSDGVRNQNETGVDCGGVCVTTTAETCNNIDDNKNCQVDEGGVCACNGISDPDTNKDCCVSVPSRTWSKVGESAPTYSVTSKKLVDSTVAGNPAADQFAFSGSGHVYALKVTTPNILAKYSTGTAFDSAPPLATRLWTKELNSLLSLNSPSQFLFIQHPTNWDSTDAWSTYPVKLGGYFYANKVATSPYFPGVIVLGRVDGTTSSTWEGRSQDGLAAAKFDDNGNLVWKTYFRPFGESWSMIPSPDGTYRYQYDGNVELTVDNSGNILIFGHVWDYQNVIAQYAQRKPFVAKLRGGDGKLVFAAMNPFSFQASPGSITGYANRVASEVFDAGDGTYLAVTDYSYPIGYGGETIGSYALSRLVTKPLGVVNPNPDRMEESWSVYESPSSSLTRSERRFSVYAGAFDEGKKQIVVAGSIKKLGVQNANYDYWVRVHDMDGKLLREWTYDIGGRDNYASAVTADAEGYVVAGESGIVKFYRNGQVMWKSDVQFSGGSIKNAPLEGRTTFDTRKYSGIMAGTSSLEIIQAKRLSDAQNAFSEFYDKLTPREKKSTYVGSGNFVSDMLGVGDEFCNGDDANEPFVSRTRECTASNCISNPSDAALCDKQSDCVFQGRCYSDISTVATTFFNNDRAAAWNSPWRNEVAADLTGDGKLEVCDPGQWFNPDGSLTGVVRNSGGAGLAGATVSGGTCSGGGACQPATSDGTGAYTISGIVPGSYTFTASKPGYVNDAHQNVNVQPVTPTVENFVLNIALATVSGTVRNASWFPVQGAVVKVLGTALYAVSGADGSYSISNIQPGSHDFTADKAGSSYETASQVNVQVSSPSTSLDFTLLHARGNCEDDCTTVGSNLCEADCEGKGHCIYYSDEVRQACDGTFGHIYLQDKNGIARSVLCCRGSPYQRLKAIASVPGKHVIKTETIILYKGTLAKLIKIFYTPDNK